MSLGIDYSSSDSESDTKESVTDKEIGLNESELSASCKTSVIQASIANPFDSNNYDQSSSSSDNDSNDKHFNREVKSETQTELSSAFSVGKDSLIESINSKVSIFSNPFKDQQNKEMSQLERHVKMSDNKKTVVNEGSVHKSVCWNYHKHGKCKFGNRCRFQHNDDSNFIAAKRQKTDSNKTRTGITDSLIPPAKALKTYYSQRNE